MQEEKNKWVSIFFSFLLLVGFFLPWVSWGAIPVSGYHMPSGHFFAISEKNFNLANPFPETAFLFSVFWLIPVAALLLIVLYFANKRSGLLTAVAGLLALSLTTVYFLFTSILVDLGVNHSVWSAVKPGWYITAAGAAGIIITRLPAKGLLKTLLIIAGPLATWAGFYFISRQIEGGTFDSTKTSAAAYTVNGIDLIREFAAADSAANAKYREKILAVTGRATAVEIVNDSTCNIKIEDVTGSYLIFSFIDNAVKEVQSIKAGDSISVKGSCSGSIYSSILETEAISFKRCALNTIK